MTIEQKLKNLILSRYGSIREFTNEIDMPYSTFASIIDRGIKTATIGNILKICKALNISADALSRGEIQLYSNDTSRKEIDLETIIKKTVYFYSTEPITLEGNPISQESINLIIDSLEITLELVKRREK